MPTSSGVTFTRHSTPGSDPVTVRGEAIVDGRSFVADESYARTDLRRMNISTHAEFLERIRRRIIRKIEDAIDEHQKARPQLNIQKEGTTMTDFNTHTIYLTERQERKARKGTLKHQEALDIITEGFLPEIVFAPGDVLTFDDSNSNSYEVVRVQGGSVVTRRLVGNTAGPAGETNIATLSSLVSAIREGRAARS